MKQCFCEQQNMKQLQQSMQQLQQRFIERGVRQVSKEKEVVVYVSVNNRTCNSCNRSFNIYNRVHQEIEVVVYASVSNRTCNICNRTCNICNKVHQEKSVVVNVSVCTHTVIHPWLRIRWHLWTSESCGGVVRTTTASSPYIWMYVLIQMTCESVFIFLPLPLSV